MDEGSFRGAIDRDRQETDDRQNPNEDWGFQNYAHRSLSGELCDIFGRIVEYSQDINGNKFIQKKLETATIEDKNQVSLELKPYALPLMRNAFGSRVIIKFFEHGLDLQRRELAAKLFGNVCTLIFHRYGNRVIEKALEVVDMDQKIRIVRELDNHVEMCLYDPEASYVIQKCVECVPEEHIGVIVSVCIDQIVKLAQQTYGAKIIKTILMCCKNPLTQKGVIDGIVSSVVILANNESGKYVVQFVLEHGKPEDRSKIVEKLAGNIVEMSLDKFGSNVIQKCLDFGSHCDRKLIVNEILGSTDEKEPLLRKELAEKLFGHVYTLSFGHYGNRVIQKTILKCCKNPSTQKGVIDGIVPSVVILANHPFANYLVQSVLKHGKPEDRSKIFEKLAENIVEVCLDKFGSIVIQKCWGFGSYFDRKLILNAILGSTDRNRPLKTIVKDLFGKFVVRMVLEKCDDDEQRELILSRIKIHRLSKYLL